MLNILTEPLIRVATASETRLSTLPEVYAALIADAVETFPALRPHQRHAWHAFLVQLGAMAMQKAGTESPPADAAEWAELIRGLTPDWPDDEPWHMVVEDITRPAFMQPPATSPGKETEYKNTLVTADELDMLVTSKCHDLKSSVASQGSIDDWLFALVTLQTMEGYGGAGNHGISRMNGGLGSRPAFSLAPPGGIGAHVRRDISALLTIYPAGREKHNLLWVLPWDGARLEGLLLNDLAPYYIEVCRRVRLRSGENGQLHGIKASSKAARIEGKELKGRTGDPWTPFNPNRDGLPLTLANGGFTYKRVNEYLFDWQLPDLLKPTPDELRSGETMQLVARGMVRGQGKTEGYYERRVPIRSKAKTAMLRRNGSDSAEDLGTIAQERINQVGIVQRILRHAVATFIARGEAGDANAEQRSLANPWANKLDVIVDADFFDALQDEFEHDDRIERERVRKTWLMNGKDGIVDHARSILSEATDSLPCPAIHRYRARENASGLFEGRLRGSSGLPFLFADNQEGNL